MSIYKDVIIYQPSVVRAWSIGKGTKIGAFCDIGKDVQIGKGCSIQCHVSIANECIIRNGVFLGPKVTILNDKYINGGQIFPTEVCDYARIGGGTIVLPGVKVGKNVFIGAGSLITKDVPDGSVVIGKW